MGRGGRVYTPEKTSLFELAFKMLANRHRPISPLTGPLSVEVEFFLKAPKRSRNKLPTSKPDLDNLIKGVCDAMNKVFWVDDSQIVNMKISKRYSGHPAGYISVFITRCDD